MCMGHQITLTLSDSVYETLCDWAKARKKSVKQVPAETLQAATLSEKPVTLSEDTERHTFTSCVWRVVGVMDVNGISLMRTTSKRTDGYR